MKKLLLIFAPLCLFFTLKGMEERALGTQQTTNLTSLPPELIDAIFDNVLTFKIDAINSPENNERMPEEFFFYLFFYGINNNTGESFYILTAPSIKKYIKLFAHKVFKLKRTLITIPPSCLQRINHDSPEHMYDYTDSIWALMAQKKLMNYRALENKHIKSSDGMEFLKDLPSYSDVSLYLSHNQLQSLSPEIGTFFNLVALDLSNNQLSVLPKEMTKLTNLRALVLSNNSLSIFPQNLKLENLVMLKLDNNNIASLPECFDQQFPKLTQLLLTANQLTTLPISLATLALCQICLSKNKLSDELDTRSLFACNPFLRYLNLAENKFSEVKKETIRQELKESIELTTLKL